MRRWRGKTIEMRRRRTRRGNNKIVEEGIITLRREIIKLRENIKVVVEGKTKKIEGKY